jgi:acetyltransferase-like isoleucine patch superfamily enzyme
MSSIGNHVRALVSHVVRRTQRSILAHRVRAANPTLRSDPTAQWEYSYAHLDAIQIGQNVTVQARAEIVVYKHHPHTVLEGRLILGDNSVIGVGAVILASGGTIRLGRDSGIAQNCVAVCASHRVARGLLHLRGSWDDSRTGVELGDNVWVGAGCILLPGTRIGDNSVVAAGSVVNREIPPGEIWGGIPARKIKDLPDAAPETLVRPRPQD